MDLKSIAAKPQLKRIELDDEDTVKEFGESLTFYIYDRQPIETFIRLAANQSDRFEEIVRIVNDMVLDESGERVVTDGHVLPSRIYMRVIERVVSELGK